MPASHAVADLSKQLTPAQFKKQMDERKAARDARGPLVRYDALELRLEPVGLALRDFVAFAKEMNHPETAAAHLHKTKDYIDSLIGELTTEQEKKDNERKSVAAYEPDDK